MEEGSADLNMLWSRPPQEGEPIEDQRSSTKSNISKWTLHTIINTPNYLVTWSSEQHHIRRTVPKVAEKCQHASVYIYSDHFVYNELRLNTQQILASKPLTESPKIKHIRGWLRENILYPSHPMLSHLAHYHHLPTLPQKLSTSPQFLSPFPTIPTTSKIITALEFHLAPFSSVDSTKVCRPLEQEHARTMHPWLECRKVWATDYRSGYKLKLVQYRKYCTNTVPVS